MSDEYDSDRARQALAVERSHRASPPCQPEAIVARHDFHNICRARRGCGGRRAGRPSGYGYGRSAPRLWRGKDPARRSRVTHARIRFRALGPPGAFFRAHPRWCKVRQRGAAVVRKFRGPNAFAAEYIVLMLGAGIHNYSTIFIIALLLPDNLFLYSSIICTSRVPAQSTKRVSHLRL
jgi:hypothetical protein